MGDIGEEMADDVTEVFFWFEIFLAAVCAKSFFHEVAAVEAGFVMAKMMGHPMIFFGFFSKNIEKLDLWVVVPYI